MPFKSLLFLAGFILWIRALVDIIKSEFDDKNMKVVWILLVIFLPVAGTIIYLVWGNRTKFDPEHEGEVRDIPVSGDDGEPDSNPEDQSV